MTMSFNFLQTQDKKAAEKFVKNIIKLSIKIGLLVQNDQFSEDELRTANQMAEKFRTTVMTITSFTEVMSFKDPHKSRHTLHANSPTQTSLAKKLSLR